VILVILWYLQMSPWHGVLEKMWFLCDKIWQVGFLLVQDTGIQIPDTVHKALLMTGSMRWL